MTLVLSIQSYYTTSTVDGYPQTMESHVTMLELVTIDCDENCLNESNMLLADRHIRKCLDDGILTTGMRVSVCLWREQADESMNDVSEIVDWFDTLVANVVHDESAWW